MAEAFVRTIKRDYVRVSPCPDAKTVMHQLSAWITTRFARTRHSDIVHPVSSSQLTEARDRVRSFGGYNKPVARTTSGLHGSFKRPDAIGLPCRIGAVIQHILTEWTAATTASTRRPCRTRWPGSARGQMQKFAAGKFHFEPPSPFT